jgi:hypothetical protein
MQVKRISLISLIFFCSSVFADLQNFSKFPDFEVTDSTKLPACASSKSINTPPFNAPLNIYQNPNDVKPFKSVKGGIFISTEKKGGWMYVFTDGVMKSNGEVDHIGLGWAKASDLYQMHQRNCLF